MIFFYLNLSQEDQGGCPLCRRAANADEACVHGGGGGDGGGGGGFGVCGGGVDDDDDGSDGGGGNDNDYDNVSHHINHTTLRPATLI